MRDGFDTQRFYAAIDAQRIAKGLNWKEVSEEADVSASTLSRMGKGRGPDVDGLALLLAWSGLDAGDFLTRTANQPEPMAKVSAYLRADKNLDPRAAAALEKILQAAYQQFRNDKS